MATNFHSTTLTNFHSTTRQMRTQEHEHHQNMTRFPAPLSHGSTSACSDGTVTSKLSRRIVAGAGAASLEGYLHTHNPAPTQPPTHSHNPALGAPSRYACLKSPVNETVLLERDVLTQRGRYLIQRLATLGVPPAFTWQPSSTRFQVWAGWWGWRGRQQEEEGLRAGDGGSSGARV